MSDIRKLSLRQRTKSALERIETVEQDLVRLTQGVSQTFGQVMNAGRSQEELIAAIVEIVGLDQVQAKVAEHRRAKAEDEAEKARTEIAELEKNGTLVTKGEDGGVDEDSFIVGHDVDEKGETIHPGFGHTHFKQVKPELAESVKGAKVGTKIQTKGADTEAGFVIDRIYTFVPPKPAETESETK